MLCSYLCTFAVFLTKIPSTFVSVECSVLQSYQRKKQRQATFFPDNFNSWTVFKDVLEMKQAIATLWCLSRVIPPKNFSEMFSYLLRDINLQNCCGTEGWGASVFGLHHQWPYAVFVLCNVVDDVQGTDIGLQLDFPRALVYIKHIGWICLHDGIIHNVVWFFCILIYSLVRKV